MRKHIMLVCKGLGICCARLPRPAPPGRRAEEGRGRARQQGQGCARAASAARSATCLRVAASYFT